MFLVKWVFVLGIWTGIAGAGVLGYFALTLPPVDLIERFERKPSLTFVDARGGTVATYGDLYGGLVRLEDMPPWLPMAVLATEDRRFYSHFGVDLRGIARAAVANFQAGRVVQGGSTITQQLAKNVFLDNDRSAARKIRELLLALWLERKFTKDQILTLYLNRVYLGAGTYGVEAASRRYFGKPARGVNAHEAKPSAAAATTPIGCSNRCKASSDSPIATLRSSPRWTSVCSAPPRRRWRRCSRAKARAPTSSRGRS